jgi:phospholipid/cholesterol/gamma-HCH transport system substrate-binding protein
MTSTRGAVLTRVFAGAAVIAAVLLVFVVLFGGGGGTEYSLLFQNGGQLVPGNEVKVAGEPVGTVDSIDLTDDAQAEVKVTLEQPMTEGTTAIIRSTSLSGIANRYISLAPGPDNAAEVPAGEQLATSKTTAPVDLDQLFSTFDGPTRKALQNVIQGQAEIYTGNNEGARRTYRYLAPGLQSTQRLLAELTRDQQAFEQFLIRGSSVLGAVAERRNDLSSLTSNANQALGAIAAENDSLDRSLAALPPAMRQANTTFVNLRAALDDLDPLVQTSLRVTKPLPGFLRDLRPVANDAVPVVRDLRLAVARPGNSNDLTDVLEVAPELRKNAKNARASGIAAMDATDEDVELARPYMPDFTAFVTKLGQAAGYYDADGHYVRAMPVATGAFDYAAGALLPGWTDSPTGPGADQLQFFTSTANALDPTGFDRCPGAASQTASDGSTPFIDPPFGPAGTAGAPAGECDPADMLLPGAGP